MNFQELQEAKRTFRYSSIEKDRGRYYRLRDKFVKYFSIDKLSKMEIDEYVIGKGVKENNFCYGLERTLDPLGRILGSTSTKFGIYYSRTDKDYKFVKRFGDSDYKKAYENVRKCIVDLVNAGAEKDFEAIIKNPLSVMLKGKILSTYYPEQYLNIFSIDHLNYYLRALDLDTEELIKSDPLYKRKALVDFKNRDSDMKTWSLDMFSYFLYSQYPKAPLDPSENTVKNTDDTDIVFPTTDNYKYVDGMIIDTPNDDAFSSKGKQSVSPSPDYEKEAQKHKRLGDRGEKIVMSAEIKRVKKELSLDEDEAKNKVKWRSRESDSYGYDIESVNEDNSPRYIEVKATQGKVGDMSFFYTLNELETAKKYGKSYFLYIVYEILSRQPKIWVIQNPFLEEGKMNLRPIQFKVDVKTKAIISYGE